VFSAAVARAEAVFLALRTARGLDAARFAAEFGAPPRDFFARSIDELVAAGLLVERRGGDLSLTPRGRLLADSVAEHFV
jgi:oxygen-independent coproporphyrinogen-3 oxidase